MQRGRKHIHWPLHSSLEIFEIPKQVRKPKVSAFYLSNKKSTIIIEQMIQNLSTAEMGTLKMTMSYPHHTTHIRNIRISIAQRIKQNFFWRQRRSKRHP